MINVSENEKAQKGQTKLLAILITIGAVGLTSLYLYLSDSDSNGSHKDENEKIEYASAMDNVDAPKSVLETTQKKLNESDKKSSEMQKQIDQLKAEKNEIVEQYKKNESEWNDRIAKLEMKYSTPPNPVASLSTNGSNNAMQGSQSMMLPLPPGISSGSVPDAIVPSIPGIREDTLTLPSLDAEENRVPVKNPETYVPAGTFVKAVMLGGADASAAVNAQSNPTPMLFRIVEQGTLPNHKKSHLKDCVVTAAVVGDVSSERGMIRLESLSCTFPNNQIVDQTVEGTVFGTEGKNGVRGIPVWRENALIQRAFVAGTLSGLSEGLSQTYTSNSVSSLGNVQTVNPNKVFQYGGAKGVGKAMDKLADYNIQRAEQYHPVIQLSAGTVVDIVFMKGFFLDGKSRDTSTTSNALSNAQASQPSLFSPPTSTSFTTEHHYATALPLTEREVKKLQERSKELGLRVTQSS